MQYFIDVILPLPLERYFTYSINEAEYKFLQPGMRVAVPFRKSKIYTGIVQKVHQNNTATYEIKDIEFIIDDNPIVTKDQLIFWEWISSYYLCAVGQVMRAALPKSFLLESETIILKNETYLLNEEELNDREYLVLEALESRNALKVQDVMNILDRKSVLPILQKMLDKGYIILQEELYNTYKPKTEKFIYLHEELKDEERLKMILEELTRAPKQRDAVMTLFMMQAGNSRPVSKKQLIERANVTSGVIKSLVTKEIVIELEEEIDRVLDKKEEGSGLYTLNEEQSVAFKEIKNYFEERKTVLLHGVTSSGKTQLYVQLIKEQLEKGNQALYLLPEIALTTQLISRLKNFFTHQVLVYHSRYNLNERLEVWNHVLHAQEPYIIIGARSSMLLPFKNLGLVIVDEEHETSFKQYDPAPRYHARDAAIVLGHLKKASVLLGSATPALESYYNASTGKYRLVELKKRFGNVLMPEINMVDIKEKHKRKKMNGRFSNTLIDSMQEAFKNKKQVILFQNRRGYAPIMECDTCGNAPQCPNCDVSLTYHQYKGQLRCHYCGYHTFVPKECPSCTSPSLDTKGFGTEQIEQEFRMLFPNHKVARMDLDTTRGKNSYQKLIHDMDTGAIDCLVGTQMLTKGLDFRNVSLVGVMNADSMLNFPDFRAHERCFQLLTQVAGRAGRTDDRGKVLIQSYNPDHRILQQVSAYDYKNMYEEQIEERYQFKYPPFQRLIRITFKHRDYQTTLDSSTWFVNALNQIPHGVVVLGPEFPPVSRIRNLYNIHVVIKLAKSQSPEQIKGFIMKVKKSFEAISQYRSVRCNIDVDAY
ncbi:replication restart DNA helicase PriA [Nonlabens dokdonensis]|uniref:Replication restart protein PriA n=2 Tax=Nonlabens dokdonensis TaxID=328515 RepID=L7WDV6_NONDD|nr:primosomal protein N' [Nonlabens dokdonensis]AGC78121.1 primosomal protein N' (Replication factor Y)-superfamily II helicase [Nonlabens dokdonensis DSW-6]PZX37182.1 replication restart DNA helicase PriA [Nonlabens dokdonensis]